MSVLRSVIKLRRIALPREILRKTSQYNGITARGKSPTGPLQNVAKKIKTPEEIAYTLDFVNTLIEQEYQLSARSHFYPETNVEPTPPPMYSEG